MEIRADIDIHDEASFQAAQELYNRLLFQSAAGIESEEWDDIRFVQLERAVAEYRDARDEEEAAEAGEL